MLCRDFDFLKALLRLFGLKFHKDDDYLICIRSKCVSVLKGNGPSQGCQDIYMYYIGIVLHKRRRYIFRKKSSFFIDVMDDNDRDPNMVDKGGLL